MIYLSSLLPRQYPSDAEALLAALAAQNRRSILWRKMTPLKQATGKPIVSGASLKKSNISDIGSKSKMKFDLGDRVRILASGQTGSICDDLIRDGQQLYIVDCFGECDSEEMIDCVRVVAEHEIEAI